MLFEYDAVAAGDISSRLRQMGCSTALFSDCDKTDIFSEIEVHSPDLVFMNARIPGPMGSLEAASEIRSRRNIPVILIMDPSDEEMIRISASLDPREYLFRPIDSRSLVEVLDFADGRERSGKADSDETRRLQAAFASVGDGMIFIDNKLRITGMNPSAERITGYGIEESKGLPLDWVFSVWNEKTGRPLEIRGPESCGRIDGDIHALKTRTERVIHIEGDLKSVASASGIPDGFVLVFRAVDARRQQIDRLIKKDERYRLLFEHTDSGVIILDSNGSADDYIIMDCNSSAEKIDGTAKNDIIGRRFTDIFPAVRNSTLLETINSVCRTGEKALMKGIPCSVGDRESWRDFSIYKLPSGELVCLFNDMTRLTETEQALAESEREKKTILNSMPQLVFLIDREKKIRWMNSAARRLAEARRRRWLLL
jgi:PAS domain S-box-containing protein